MELVQLGLGLLGLLVVLFVASPGISKLMQQRHDARVSQLRRELATEKTLRTSAEANVAEFRGVIDRARPTIVNIIERSPLMSDDAIVLRDVVKGFDAVLPRNQNTPALRTNRRHHRADE